MYFDEPEVPSATSAPVCVALERRVVVDAAKLIVSEFDAVLSFPKASVNLLAATDTVPVPDVSPDAVKVTVRDVPDVVSAESEPRVTLKSSRVRSLVVSLRVIEMVHVEPETYGAVQPERAMVGWTPSTFCVACVAIALWVSVALLDEVSAIVPPFRASVFAVIANPSESISFDATE